jgi:hypothetical protein
MRAGWDDSPGGLLRNGDLLQWPEWRLEGDGDVLDATGTVSMECDPPAIRLRAVGDLLNPPKRGGSTITSGP